MKSFTIEEYVAAGCPEMKHESMCAVHMLMGGRVCDTGCHAYNNGRCRHYMQLTTGVAPAVPKTYTETVRQEAQRLGVSIGEVRRRRAAEQVGV